VSSEKHFTSKENNVINSIMKEMVGVRLEKQLKKLLQKQADTEERPLSNYIRYIIIDWLRNQGIEYPPQKK
jgi:hypothetical protein